MTPEEQEALSRVYSDNAFILLRLSTGNFALFDNRRRLLQIGPLVELRFESADTILSDLLRE